MSLLGVPNLGRPENVNEFAPVKEPTKISKGPIHKFTQSRHFEPYVKEPKDNEDTVNYP